MAENFSFKPDTEATTPVALSELSGDAPLTLERAPRKNRAMVLIENLFGGREAKEKKEDEDDEEAEPSKQGRVRNLWRRLFPSIVDQEQIGSEPRDRGSLFFGVERTGGADEPTHEPLHTDVVRSIDMPMLDAAPVTAERPIDLPPPEAAEPAVPEAAPSEVTEVPAEVHAEAPAEAPTSDTEVVSEPERTEVVHYTSRAASPEVVVLGAAAAYEHHRVTKLKKHGEKLQNEFKDLKREVKETKEHISRQATAEAMRPRADAQPVAIFERSPQPARAPEAARESAPQHHAERIEQPQASEKKRPEILYSRSAQAEKSPEKSPQETPTASSEQLKPQEKQEIIERILTKPEHLKNVETDEHKEIAYELSHEHKDLDRQGAAAWHALQAKADETAKANAQAVAQAARVAGTPTPDDLSQAAAHQKALHTKQSQYKKAAVSGFVTAVVLVAVVVAIIVLRSK